MRPWISAHPITALMLWFFTVGQAVAFLPVLARSGGAELPMQPFAVASTWAGLLLPALVVTWCEDGRAATAGFLRRVTVLPRPPIWWAVPAVLVPGLTWLLAVGVTDHAQATPANVVVAYVSGVLLQAVVHLLTNNLWEELVWIGFVQLRLQARHTPLKAAVLVAPLFALQHAALIADNRPLAGLLVMVVLVVLAVPYRATMGWLYNRTGSLLLVAAAHACGNATVTGTVLGAGFLPALYGNNPGPIHLFAFAGLGALLCLCTKGRLGGSTPSHASAQLIEPKTGEDR